jgi:DNA-binding LacI/PurR family transcriptional regulator
MRTALTRVGLELPEELIWQGGDFSGFGDMEGAELGRMGVRELLSRGDPPTAVLCGNDMYALGAYAGARDLGYEVARDLSIVGFDDIFMAEIVQPQLTTIRQPVPAMAAQMVTLLIDHVEGRPSSRDATFVSIPPQLVVRGSTGPGPYREGKSR